MQPLLLVGYSISPVEPFPSINSLIFWEMKTQYVPVWS
jgi:hypothetical protein